MLKEECTCPSPDQASCVYPKLLLQKDYCELQKEHYELQKEYYDLFRFKRRYEYLTEDLSELLNISCRGVINHQKAYDTLPFMGYDEKETIDKITEFVQDDDKKVEIEAIKGMVTAIRDDHKYIRNMIRISNFLTKMMMLEVNQ